MFAENIPDVPQADSVPGQLHIHHTILYLHAHPRLFWPSHSGVESPMPGLHECESYFLAFATFEQAHGRMLQS
jgi:hypothetical protein